MMQRKETKAVTIKRDNEAHNSRTANAHRLKRVASHRLRQALRKRDKE